jgi:hypothetical protein
MIIHSSSKNYVEFVNHLTQTNCVFHIQQEVGAERRVPIQDPLTLAFGRN